MGDSNNFSLNNEEVLEDVTAEDDMSSSFIRDIEAGDDADVEDVVEEEEFLFVLAPLGFPPRLTSSSTRSAI